MRHASRGWIAAVGGGALLLTLAACTPPEPPPAAEPTPEAPAATMAAEPAARAPVTFTATEFQYAGPASIPAGLTEVEFVNAGQQSHGLTIVGLEDGKTAQDIVGILDDEGPIPSWVTFAGGVGGLPPGGSGRVVLDFAPGKYAVFSFEGEPVDATKGMIQDLEVTADDGSAATVPEAGTTVDLLDFSFAPSGPIASGTQTLAVRNKGQQPHEALIMKLEPGVTGEDVVKMITEFMAAPSPEAGATAEGGAGTPAAGSPEAGGAEAAPPEAPPFNSAGGVTPIDPGETAVLTQDFAPGNYLFICFIPDTSDGTPHLAKGMSLPFTVE